MDKNDTLLEKQAVMGLRKCVAGHPVKEVKTTFEIDDNGDRRIKSEVVTTKTIPPELSAIVFTLTNLNPARWKAKPDGGITEDETGEEVDLSKLSDEALKELSGYIETSLSDS